MIEAVEGLVTVWSQHKELLVKDKIALLLLDSKIQNTPSSLSTSWCIEGLSIPLTTRSGSFFKRYPTAEHWLLVVFNAVLSDSVYSGTAFMEDFSEGLGNRAVFSLCGTTPLQKVVLN
jgi:hypothetical protein